MLDNTELGPSTLLSVIKVTNADVTKCDEAIATEIPLTILAGEVEIATQQCSPSYLKELVYGFFFTAGFIASATEIKSFVLDSIKWIAHLEMDDLPDPALLSKRIYTSGCGKGVTFAHMNEAASRLPLSSDLTITRQQVVDLAHWLQNSSKLYKSTRGIHTAALSLLGADPETGIDDIGRHNAVDKVIGNGLLAGVDFSQTIMICSGRISSEILHKTKRCGIPIIIARGGPTHQTVLRARDMGTTVIGLARGSTFTVYSHEQRIHF